MSSATEKGSWGSASFYGCLCFLPPPESSPLSTPFVSKLRGLVSPPKYPTPCNCCTFTQALVGAVESLIQEVFFSLVFKEGVGVRAEVESLSSQEDS